MTTLPRQFDAGAMRTISLIDVIWLKKSSIVAPFEVEHTSTVYSGLLRMSDLRTMQPTLGIKLLAKLKCAEGFLQHLRESFLDELVEPYGPAEAFED